MSLVRGCRIVCVAGMLFALGGCASLKEGARGFAGVSTRALEEFRNEAAVKEFVMEYDACYNKASKILTRIGTYAYARRRDMIAVYLSETDTTPVGVFLTQLGPAHTRLEVSSPSSFARDKVSGVLFALMEKPLEELDRKEEGDTTQEAQS